MAGLGSACLGMNDRGSEQSTADPQRGSGQGGLSAVLLDLLYRDSAIRGESTGHMGFADDDAGQGGGVGLGDARGNHAHL